MTTTQNIFTKALRLVHYYPRSIWWITTRILFFTLLVVAARLCLRPQFTARSTMTTLPSRFELIYTEARADVHSALGPAMILTQTHTEYLLSRTLAADVISQLRQEGMLVDHADGFTRYVVRPVSRFLQATRSLVRYGRFITVPPEEALVNRMRGAISVRNVPASFILEVAVRWSNPVTAARAVNILTKRYEEMVSEANQKEMSVTREFINNRIAETTQELNRIESAIKEFKGGKGFYQGETDYGLKMNEMANCLKELRKSQATANELEHRLRILKDYRSPAALSDLTAELAGVRSRETSLEQSYKTVEKELSQFPALEQELLALYRERAERTANLETLHTSLTRTEIAEASQISSVRIIDSAVVPLFPSSSNIAVSAMSALLVGLLLSAMYIAAMEYMRPHLRSRADFEGMGVSLMGLVPYDQHSANRAQRHMTAGSATRRDGQASALNRFVFGCQRWERRLRRKTPAERPPLDEDWILYNRRAFNSHLDHMVSHLTESHRGIPIVFTSMDEECGKSFVIEHLAIRAEYIGKKVLIVDANTEYPRMRQVFGAPSAKAALTDALTGGCRLEEAVLTVAAGIDMVPAEAQPGGNRGAWDIAGVREQIRSIGQRYDLIMIDTGSLRGDPLVRQLWGLSGHMVCVLDATACTVDSLADLRGRIARYENKVDYVLNYVRFSGDYLYES